MTAQPITKKTAQRILRAVDRLCDLIDAGEDRVQAGVKVASELQLTAPQIELVCRGYNDGVVNTMRRSHTKFASKFAVPETIDPADVIAVLFPSEPKVASSRPVIADVYRPEVRSVATKAAADRSEAKAHRVARCKCGCGERKGRCKYAGLSDYGQAKRELEPLKVAREQTRRLRNEVFLKSAAVIDAYRDEHGNDLSLLPTYAKFAAELYGQPGREVVNRAASKLLQPRQFRKYATEIRISAVQPIPRDAKRGVLLAVKQAVEAGHRWAAAEAELPQIAIEAHRRARHRQSLEKVANLLRVPGETPDDLVQQAWTKRADALSTMLGAVAGRMSGGGKSTGNTDGTDNRMLQARLMLNNPSHQAELKRIQAETLLNRLINSDDVIGSYDPDQIADAFEEISTSAPAIATNSTLLRAHLRRQLQGNMTPFEANDMVQFGQKGELSDAVPFTGLPSNKGY